MTDSWPGDAGHVYGSPRPEAEMPRPPIWLASAGTLVLAALTAAAMALVGRPAGDAPSAQPTPGSTTSTEHFDGRPSPVPTAATSTSRPADGPGSGACRSDDRCQVPNLVRMSRHAAEEMLASRDLRWEVVTVTGLDGVPDGEVVRQDPRPWVWRARGSVITLAVAATIPEPSPSPDQPSSSPGPSASNSDSSG